MNRRAESPGAALKRELRAELKLLARERSPEIARALKRFLEDPGRVVEVADLYEELARLRAELAIESEPTRASLLRDLLDDAEIRVGLRLDRQRLVSGWEDIEKQQEIKRVVERILADVAKAAVSIAARILKG